MESGVFTEDAKISISTATPGTKIHFTLDGTDPTLDSPVATSPLSITETGHILKVMVAKPGMTPSDVITFGDGAPVVVKAIPPVITPGVGSFINEVLVAMSCTETGCTIHYTLDKEMPTTASPIYTGPVRITTTGTVVQAIAVATGKASSDMTSSSALAIQLSEPIIYANGSQWGNPPAGVEDFVQEAIVHIDSSCATVQRCRSPPAKIYYTLNGEKPDILTSQLYHPTNPIIISAATNPASLQIRAIAVAEGMEPSDVSTSDLLEIIRRAFRPKIYPASGTTHIRTVQVSITNMEHGAKVYFTTDGKDPTLQSQVYLAPFEIPCNCDEEKERDVVVKARVIGDCGAGVIIGGGCEEGVADSKVQTASFKVLDQVKTPSFDLISMAGVLVCLCLSVCICLSWCVS